MKRLHTFWVMPGWANPGTWAMLMTLVHFSLSSPADTVFVARPSMAEWNPDLSHIVFSDEFEGDSLDPSVWNLELCQGRHGPPNHDLLTSNGGEHENIEVSEGTLKMIARHEPGYLNDHCWSGPFTSDYTTAEIYTKRPRYSYRYCIFEARCKIPRGYGLFPAFWLWGPGDRNGFPQDGYGSEIDVAEAIQRRKNDRFIHAFHWWIPPGGEDHINEGSFNMGTDLLGEWHTYKVIWTPHEVRFFVDDRQSWARSRYFRGDDAMKNDVFVEDIQPGIPYGIHEWFPRHICEIRFQMQLNRDIIGRELSSLPAILEVDHVRVRRFLPPPDILLPDSHASCDNQTAIVNAYPGIHYHCGDFRLSLITDHAMGATTITLENQTTETAFCQRPPWEIEIYGPSNALMFEEEDLRGKYVVVSTGGWERGVYYVRAMTRNIMLLGRLPLD